MDTIKNMDKEKLFPVGTYREEFNTITGQNLPCGTIYQSSGLAVHIQKRHPKELSNLSLIEIVIKTPDYIGKHPKEADSIELVKHLDNNVMVCIKLDTKDNYLYVASVFNINESKLKSRLKSGRLKKFDKNPWL